MAEGFLRHFAGDGFDVYSAGTRPVGVNPLTIAAMREVGVDISSHTSTSLDQFQDQPFDFVITVCDHAQEHCPVFPGNGTYLHWNFEDPASADGDEAEKLLVFRRVRQEISERLQQFLNDSFPS